jgi:RHS repeat-associated protein
VNLTSSGSLDVSNWSLVSDTEITATVTVGAADPTQTACVVAMYLAFGPIRRLDQQTGNPNLCPPQTSAGASFPVEIVGSSKNIGDPCDIPGCDGVGDPINTSSGDVFEAVTDYQTAGQNRLDYTRYYNSLTVAYTFASELGTNWRSNYDRFLQLNSGSQVIAERPDGQLIGFTNTGGSWGTDSDVDYTLTGSGTTWTLTDHSGTTEVYSTFNGTEALLQSITLRNGYTKNLAYNSNGQLATVTDSYGRQLVFTYTNGVVSTVTTPDGLVLTYGYNSVNNPDDQLTSVSYSTSPPTSQQYLYQNSNLPYALTGIVDENGSTYASWTYDCSGRGLTSQVGGVANLTTVTYDDTQNTRTVTNAFGVTDTYSVSFLQNDWKTTNISRAATGTTAAATETLAYDSNGYLSSRTDWNGNQTTYVNDSHGDPTTINEAVGSSVARTTTIAYDPTFVQLPDTITTPGLTTAFTYDGNGNILKKTLTDTTQFPSGPTRVWQYTWQNSLLASVQSPRTEIVEKTSFTYDTTGALTLIANPLNQQTTITSHSPGGYPLAITDPNGVMTSLVYDARLRLLSRTVVLASGNRVTSYGYDAAGNLTSLTLPDGSGLTYSYDAAHRLTGIRDLFGQSTAYTLDALGDSTATSIANASGTVTSQHSESFDALGRMLTDTGASGQTSSYTYDAMGNRLTATDQLSNTTGQAFDALNRLYQVTDPAHGITATVYDAHDRPLSVTAPAGVATTYVYDGFGDVIQESSPNTGTAAYSYDSDGNLAQRIASTGATTQYTYDALNRIGTKTFPADSAENVTYTYDQNGHGAGIGRLTSVTDAAGTLSRSYDFLGNLLSDVRVSGTSTLTTSYTYDAANRVTSITYPSSAVVSYTRDTMGRITSVNTQAPGSSSVPVVSSIGYEPFGPNTALTYGNGVSETRSFDGDYRLTALADAGTSSLQNLSYAYYPTNNVETITDAVTPGNSQSFSYDPLHRLTQAQGGNGSYAYTYDGDGNRQSITFGSGTTTYGYQSGSDLLTSLSLGGVVEQTLGYTADGRLNSLNPGLDSPGNQLISSATYNQDARLASFNAGGQPLATYTYDGFGQRLLKTVSSTYGNIYQYDQTGMLLEETDASGNAQADYIYLNGRPVAVLDPSTGALSFLSDNQLGAPQLATDSGQNIVWQATYDPFGQTPTLSGTITQNLRLPGQYFDQEIGLYQNGFRDYLPNFGRYAEPDPLAMQGTARFYDPSSGRGLSSEPVSFFVGAGDYYSYAGDNPVDLIDPLGLCKSKSRQQCEQQAADQLQTAMDHADQDFTPRGMLENATEGFLGGALVGCVGGGFAVAWAGPEALPAGCAAGGLVGGGWGAPGNIVFEQVKSFIKALDAKQEYDKQMAACASL